MLSLITRNTIFIGAMAVGAIVGGLLAPWTVSARGAFGPTILQAQSVPLAVLAAVISLAVCTGLAVLVCRVCNPAVAMFSLGGGLFGLAWRMEGAQELMHSGSFALLPIESVLWALAVFGATVIVFKLGGPMRDVDPDTTGRVHDGLFSLAALKAAAPGVLVLPVVWVLAQSPMKGQMIGSVFVGAMVAGLLGRVLSPHVQPLLLFASPVLFGAIGQWIGIATLGASPVDAWVAKAFPHLLLPMPVDYAAASMMGVAFGLGLAKSSVHHEQPSAQSAESARSAEPAPRPRV